MLIYIRGRYVPKFIIWIRILRAPATFHPAWQIVISLHFFYNVKHPFSGSHYKRRAYPTKGDVGIGPCPHNQSGPIGIRVDACLFGCAQHAHATAFIPGNIQPFTEMTTTLDRQLQECQFVYFRPALDADRLHSVVYSAKIKRDVTIAHIHAYHRYVISVLELHKQTFTVIGYFVRRKHFRLSRIHQKVFIIVWPVLCQSTKRDTPLHYVEAFLSTKLIPQTQCISFTGKLKSESSVFKNHTFTSIRDASRQHNTGEKADCVCQKTSCHL